MTPDSPSAFPSGSQFSHRGKCANSDAELHGGMALRDYFAGQVLSGLVTGWDIAVRDGASLGPIQNSAKDFAAEAYDLADVMLAERSKAQAS